MSQRHRTEAAALPPREELRAHARSERHRINSELHTLSTVVGSIGGYGAAWLRPTEILTARVIKFGAQIDW